MEQFIEQIIKNLENNGYPNKRVSLPLEKMYEVADNKGLSFNTVLEELKAKHGIDSRNEVEKVIFFPVVQSGANPFAGLDIEGLRNMDQADLMGKVQEMMSSMSPEQMAEIKKMYEGMSDSEKAEIMEKGKKMGLM